MTSKHKALKVAVIVAAMAGIAAPITAYADSKPGQHLIGIRYGGAFATTTHGVQINNKGHDGNVKCYDISGLRPDNKAFTIDYTVYNGETVRFDWFTSNICDPDTATTHYTEVTPVADGHKYLYVDRLGDG